MDSMVQTAGRWLLVWLLVFITLRTVIVTIPSSFHSLRTLQVTPFTSPLHIRTMPVRPWYKRKRNLILLAIVVILTTAIAAPLAIFKPWEGSSQSNLLPRDAMITPSSDNSAQVNQYTPPLDQPFDYQKGDVKIRGVSLGGWLVLEPFITPSLFNPYVPNGVVDEWTLCAHLGPDAATNLVEEHYATWVTEDTFVQIKDLGLNHVRIPIGYWAMGNLTTDEPFIPDLSWKYLLRGIEWARKYGIRVMVELHAAPGSQNGWNQSGKMGQITWINGTTGWTNAQRTLSYLQNMAAFFASPDYMHVNTLMGLLNEPAARAIGADNVMAWYRLALETVRNATGNGKGPWAIIHDGFLGLQAWSDFMRGSDRLMIDVHQFVVFSPRLMAMSRSAQLRTACEEWSADSIRSTATFGPTMVGEFSVATNDCAQYVNGIDGKPRWQGDCTYENDVSTFSPEYKTFLTNFFNAQLDAFEQGIGWFYWNFKTETNPVWSYVDGVKHGWIPKDVNDRGPGFCAPNGYNVRV